MPESRIRPSFLDALAMQRATPLETPDPYGIITEAKRILANPEDAAEIEMRMILRGLIPAYQIEAPARLARAFRGYVPPPEP